MSIEEYIKLPNLFGKKENFNLKVIYKNHEILGLEKPEGVLIDAFPWYPDIPSIVYNLKEEVSKGALDEYHLQNIYGVYALEPEVTGVALIATNKESSSYLRNVFGSDKMLFRFTLLAKSDVAADSLVCELPIAKHSRENRALISHKTGKKSKTLFNLIAKDGNYQIWEAQTTYLRMHQIRLHAMESGLNIIGEKLYTSKQIDNSQNEGIFLHLSSIEWGEEESKIKIHSQLPEKMKTFLLNTVKMSPQIVGSL